MRRGFPIFVFMVLVSLSCTDLSEPGTESLVDPKIKPKVIYTFPPMNSEGPYEAMNIYDYYYTYPIKIRFNKIMDEKSVLKSFSLKSDNTTYIVDLNSPDVFLNGDEFQIRPYPFNLSSCRLRELFTLNISSDAKDINGNILTPSFSTTFMPEPYFRIKKVIPIEGTQNFTYGNEIRLYFNSQIDNSFFSYLDINPPLSGSWYYYYDSTMIYFDYAAIFPDQTYTITVKEGACDRYNNRTKNSFSSKFTTTNFHITFRSPSGYYEIPLDEAIRINFSCPVDTLTLQNAFKLSPDTDGILVIKENATEIIFYPQPEWQTYTNYSVLIDTTLTSKNGFHLERPFLLSFSTTGFRVSSRYPDESELKYKFPEYVYLVFTAKLDTSTVRSAFTIDPPIKSTLIYDYGYNYIRLVPDAKFEEYITYTVTIDSTLRSIGGARLSRPYKFSFTPR